MSQPISTPSNDFQPLPEEALDRPLLVTLAYRAWEPSHKWAAAVDGTYLWKYAELKDQAVHDAIVAYLGCDDNDDMATSAQRAARIRQFELRKGTGYRPRS